VVQRIATEMSGPQVVVLAHTWNATGTREERVFAAIQQSAYFPIILVSSGHALFTGPTSPYATYRSMIQTDLARPATGELAAWWRRDGNDVAVWATLRNLGPGTLSQAANGAAFTAMVYEPIYEYPFQNPVRGATEVPLASAVAAGATAQFQARVVRPGVADWSRAAVVALVDYRPGGTTGTYDVVQAAQAGPAALAAAPTEIAVSVVPGATAPVDRALALSGPSVLSWTATADASWVEIVPATGTLPASPVVRVHPDRLPSASATATVTVVASGAGMSFTQAVPVRVSAGRLVRRHLSRR
jgi:hypothetical protein